MSEKLLWYRPRLRTIIRKGKKPLYWWTYYLPRGTNIHHRVYRTVCDDARVAKADGRLKEGQLLRSEFDNWDRLRMEASPYVRLTVKDAKAIYVNKGMAAYSPLGKNSVKPVIERIFDFFVKNCGRTYVDEINEDDFLKLRDHLATTGFVHPVKRYTLNRYQTWTNTALNWFVAKGNLTKNPIAGLKKLKLSMSEKVRGKVIPLEEWLRIVSAPSPTEFGFDIRPIVIFATATGLRAGEIIHLQWSDIDRLEGVIRIRVKHQCPTWHGLSWRPKGSVEGDPPLNELACLVLDSIEKHDEVWGSYQCGTETKEMATDFVFARKDKNGRLVRIRSLREAWARLLENAGLAGKYKFKDLRATANTYFKVYCQLTGDEASKVLRNTPEVNLQHYTGTLTKVLQTKMGKLPPEMAEAARKVLPDGSRTIH